MQKIKKKSKNKLTLVNWMILILGLQFGLVFFILSAFLSRQIGEKNVGWLFLLGYLISFYILLKIHLLIRTLGKSQTLFIFMAINWISLIGMGAFWLHPISAIFGVFMLIGGATSWAILDTLIESYSDDKTTGKTRGLFLVVLNLGILIGPFLSTWLVQNYENGFQLVFYLTSFLMFIPLIILTLFFSEREYGVRRRGERFFAIKELFRRRNLLRIYWAAFLLDLFYSVVVVYVPVHLLNMGLSWLEIGKIFTVMLVPFVILQYPLGIIADRKTGEKCWLIGSLVILAVSTVGIGLVSTPNVLIWTLMLLLTRVGAAILEVMRDAYFYKKVGPKDIELMDLFRTTRSLAYMIGMPVFLLLLLVFPLNPNYVFILLGAIIGFGVIPLFKLENTAVSG